ncbi:glycoside hydrolase family 19 protein [Rhodococcus sp. CH91]|uniref:glycoside hydrolase family 19 protein n=1 Tax=Rhodococcus sp. CH91 TaxID=2910256 RepID=UPI001F4B2227|nr:glycoside hydrolase family 19 protein [Rhodococcus sp. CH91]
MSVSSSRRFRAAIAAAAVITTAVGVGTSAAAADPAPSAPTKFQDPGNLLEALDMQALSTSGWTGAETPAAVTPAAPPEAVDIAPAPAPAPPPPAVTHEDLARIVPGIPPERLDQFIGPLNDAMVRHGIDTPVRQAAFIAQLAVESDSFRTFEEYASGRAYEGRADLGNNQPGDGERYKGRGAIQITGRHNYQKVSEHTGVDFVAHPELLAAPENAFTTAAWYWTSRNLNEVADTAGIVRVSELVNGGHHALSRRIADFERGLNVLLQP